MTTTRRARTTKYFQVATSQDQDVCVAGCPLPLQLRSYGATGFAGLVLSWQLPTPTNRHTRHANLRLRFPARRPITNHSNLSFYVETTSSSLRATKTVSLTVKHAHETPHCSRRGERRRRQPARVRVAAPRGPRRPRRRRLPRRSSVEHERRSRADGKQRPGRVKSFAKVKLGRGKLANTTSCRLPPDRSFPVRQPREAHTVIPSLLVSYRPLAQPLIALASYKCRQPCLLDVKRQ